MIIKEIKKQDPDPGSLVGLRDYLENNKKDHRLERIADRFLFNCRQDFDIGGACFEMMAVATRNERCKKSSRYAHYVISLREGEKLTHEEWSETLKSILKRMGMDDHQAFAVMHKDTEFEHVHLVVNRIDKTNYKRTELHHEHQRLNDLCKILDKKVGQSDYLDFIKSLGNSKELNEKLDLKVQEQVKERKIQGECKTGKTRRTADHIEAKTGRQSFLSYVQSFKDELEGCTSINEFNKVLADHSVKYVKHGRGYVFQSNDEKYAVKASDISRYLTSKYLLKRFGALPDNEEPLRSQNDKKSKSKPKHEYKQEPLPYLKSVSFKYIKFLQSLEAEEFKKRTEKRNDHVVVTKNGFLYSKNPTFTTIRESLIILATRSKKKSRIKTRGDYLFQLNAARVAMSLGLGSMIHFENPAVQAIYNNMVKENEVSNDHRRESNTNVQERGDRDEARKSSPVQKMPVRSMDDGKVHGQAEPTAISRTVQMPDNWFMDLQHPARQSGENTPDHRMSDANSGKRVKHSRGR